VKTRDEVEERGWRMSGVHSQKKILFTSPPSTYVCKFLPIAFRDLPV
jgi:hypothetical protein